MFEDYILVRVENPQRMIKRKTLIFLPPETVDVSFYQDTIEYVVERALPYYSVMGSDYREPHVIVEIELKSIPQNHAYQGKSTWSDLEYEYVRFDFDVHAPEAERVLMLQNALYCKPGYICYHFEDNEENFSVFLKKHRTLKVM